MAAGDDSPATEEAGVGDNSQRVMTLPLSSRPRGRLPPTSSVNRRSPIPPPRSRSTDDTRLTWHVDVVSGAST